MIRTHLCPRDSANDIDDTLIPFEPLTYEHLGNILGSQSRSAEARSQVKKLVKLRPDYAEAYRYLGSTYLETGQLTLAAANFEKAIRHFRSISADST